MVVVYSVACLRISSRFAWGCGNQLVGVWSECRTFILQRRKNDEKFFSETSEGFPCEILHHLTFPAICYLVLTDNVLLSL